ncbi:MAG TPA: CHAT domain-containing protein [Thermoanaerobaculia bacterium]|nr:CHAT domain-containing protein [Thermoanaerobaculia bacterium]
MLQRCVVHVYTFDLKKGDFQRLVFDQRGVDIKVEVFDPQGAKVVTVDGMNLSQGPEDVPWVAASTGKYQVKVSSTQGGTYASTTFLQRRATPQDKTRAAAAIAYSQGKDLKSKDARKAESRFQEAARLAGEVKDSLREADAWNQLGDLQCREDHWAEGGGSYTRALRIYDSLGQRVQLPGMLTKMAPALHNAGDSKAAIAAYERCIGFLHDLGRLKDEAHARRGLGGVQLDTGKIDQAVTNLQEAARLYHQQGDTPDEAQTLLSCGRAYSKMGELDQALIAQNQALEEFSKGKDLFWAAMALSYLGDTFREAGFYDQAVPYYRRALSIFRCLGFGGNEAGTFNQLGLAYQQLKKFKDAKDAFQSALKIFQHQHMASQEANSWINLGSVDIALGSIPQAIESIQRALDINRQQKRLDTEASAYFQLAWAERRRNSPAAARANAARAIKALESLRSANQEPVVRAQLLIPWQWLYELQVELLMDQHRLKRTAGHDIEAFDASEHARARMLLESLGELSAPQPLSLREIQRQVVDQDTVLLEYFLGKERSYLWVVTPQEYSSFELPGRDQIEPLARKVYELLTHSHHRQDQPEAVRQARALSQMLLGPVALRLGNKRLLIVVPPELQYVPFAALPDLVAAKTEEPDGGRWPRPLIVSHEIVSAPSASVIAVLRDQRDQRAGRPEPPNLLALVADPIYELKGNKPLADRFPSLPSSRKEADAIARLAGAEGVLKLYGFDANRDRVMDQLGTYRILHFSVHGEPSRTHPDQSSLVLSAFEPGGKRRDPFLRAGDIQELDLPADLAVLSACGTGLGKEIRGEGLVGLTQAFFTAGTSSVVVSLWNVDNTATTKLMPLFYFSLLKSGMHSAAALRQAQIRMWRHRQWNAPYYWAGFIEQGEWR